VKKEREAEKMIKEKLQENDKDAERKRMTLSRKMLK